MSEDRAGGEAGDKSWLDKIGQLFSSEPRSREDLDDVLARLAKRGATVVGEVVQYADMYRLCYIRGPEGILIGLAEQLGQQGSRANPM